MRPTLATTYRRTTFVSRTGECRLTCDVGLVCRDGRHEVRDTGTHVLVESKSSGAGQRPRPDPARARRAPGHGEQVLRRRRRPAPRAALQPLAPDPAALLRAARGQLPQHHGEMRSTSMRITVTRTSDGARRAGHVGRAGGLWRRHHPDHRSRRWATSPPALRPTPTPRAQPRTPSRRAPWSWSSATARSRRTTTPAPASTRTGSRTTAR